MPECKIHNVGFYKPEARAIYCMALEPKSGKLALTRYTILTAFLET